jgi:cytosine/adenosine deaminase-related metal-dependent hydrolase
MVSILIRNGIVIPVDGTQRVIEKGFLVIEEGKIADIGEVAHSRARLILIQLIPHLKI